MTSWIVTMKDGTKHTVTADRYIAEYGFLTMYSDAEVQVASFPWTQVEFVAQPGSVVTAAGSTRQERPLQE